MRNDISIICLSALLLFSCQKGYVDDGDGGKETSEDKSHVTLQLNVAQLEATPFETTYQRARSTDVSTLCTRVSVAVYQGSTRVKQVNQVATDDDFGHLSLSLPAGSYKLVVLAYSGEKAATMTNPEKITFDGKVTDTFLYTSDLDLQADLTESIDMKRVVAMFRLSTTDTIPSNIATMQFAYTGGSSTLDGTTGYGCINSRQNEKRAVTEQMKGKQGVFEVYTFPKVDNEGLKMTITALDSKGNTLASRVFEDVKVERNLITQYEGKFFDGASQGGKNYTFKLVTNDTWELSKTDF